MEDHLILFVERWFIQMTVDKYYYWLHIVSQGLYNSIVSQLGEGRSEYQDYDYDDFEYDYYYYDYYDYDDYDYE